MMASSGAVWGSIDVTERQEDEVRVEEGEVVVREEELLDWGVRSLMAAGAEESPARTHAAILLSADRRGHYSHGFNRLDIYYNDIKSGACKPNLAPVILNETVAAGFVDGRDGLGGVVSQFCMELAIKKAKEAGVGWVTARNSNHFGIAGHYSIMAQREGLLGLSFTNGSPWVTATRSRGARVMSTNPISFTAPGSGGDGLELDMATATVAVGKLEVAAVKGEEIPACWAVDGEGRETRDPRRAMREGAGLPLGGQEETGGYKGYGLALMVEILCGVMSGGTWGPNIRHWGQSDSPGGLSHSFIALDPGVCGQHFSSNLQQLLDTFRGLPPADQDLPVLVPGDKERESEERAREAGGVIYSGAQYWRFVEFSRKWDVPPPDCTPLRKTD